MKISKEGIVKKKIRNDKILRSIESFPMNFCSCAKRKILLPPKHWKMLLYLLDIPQIWNQLTATSDNGKSYQEKVLISLVR